MHVLVEGWMWFCDSKDRALKYMAKEEESRQKNRNFDFEQKSCLHENVVRQIIEDKEYNPC